MENKQRQREQREMAAHRNRLLLERETFAVSHHQKFDNSSKIVRGESNHNEQEPELFCACNGLKCEGICREQHLNRPRFANPTAKKDAGVKKMWTEKCPEAYEKDKHYRT